MSDQIKQTSIDFDDREMVDELRQATNGKSEVMVRSLTMTRKEKVRTGLSYIFDEPTV